MKPETNQPTAMCILVAFGATGDTEEEGGFSVDFCSPKRLFMETIFCERIY